MIQRDADFKNWAITHEVIQENETHTNIILQDINRQLDTHDDKTADKRNIYFYINHWILTFKTFLCDELTFLLQHQLQHAVTIYNNIFNQSLFKIYWYLDEINNLYLKIDDHWRKIFLNIFTKIKLFWKMLLFEQFIETKLLKNYENKLHAVHKQTFKLTKCKECSENCKSLVH